MYQETLVNYSKTIQGLYCKWSWALITCHILDCLLAMGCANASTTFLETVMGQNFGFWTVVSKVV